MVPGLCAAFKLSDDSVVERYSLSDRYWIAGRADSVFAVDQVRRVGDSAPHVLLRVRANLATVWLDADCPELEAELQRLGSRSKRPRQLDEDMHTPPSAKVQRTGDEGDERPAARRAPSSPTVEPRSALNTILERPTTTCAVTDTMTSAVKAEDSETGPNSMRRWPLDYSVQEIADGIRQMQDLVHDDPFGKLTKAAAFKQVFNTRWTHTTFYKYSHKLNSAPKGLRDRFVGYGQEPQGRWSLFMNALAVSAPSESACVSVTESNNSLQSPSPSPSPSHISPIDLSAVSPLPASSTPPVLHTASAPCASSDLFSPATSLAPSLSNSTFILSPPLQSVQSSQDSTWPLEGMSPPSSPSFRPSSLSAEEWDEMQMDPDADELDGMYLLLHDAALALSVSDIESLNP